jgi:hypothetical protein
VAERTVQWPNVERHTVAWLKAKTGHYVATETNEDLEQHLPAHTVTRVGGAPVRDSSGLTRLFLVEVETATAKSAPRGDLWDAAATVASAMWALAANGTADWYVDEVTETFPAAILDDRNDGVRRASATYGLAVRPRPTTL